MSEIERKHIVEAALGAASFFGVVLEKVPVFIEILVGGKEPGVFSAAPERRNLEIEVDVG